MLTLIIVTVVVILITIGLVKLIDKFVPSKFRPIIQVVLWALIVFLGYSTFQSVYEPIQFEKVKVKRFQKAIDGLKVIREAQLAHRQITGKFSGNFDNLVKFIDTAEYTLTQRRDTSVIDEVLTKQFGVDMYKDEVLVDTLGFVPVRDSLFKNSDSYKTMMNVPVGKEGAKYELKAGFIEQNNSQIPVFEAFVKKDVILYDQNKNLIEQENEVVSSVVGVEGDAVRVGSMNDVETGGNWAKFYDTKKQ